MDNNWKCDGCGADARYTWLKSTPENPMFLCNKCSSTFSLHELEDIDKKPEDTEFAVQTRKWEDFFGVTKERENVNRSRVDLLEYEMKKKRAEYDLHVHETMFKAYQLGIINQEDFRNYQQKIAGG